MAAPARNVVIPHMSKRNGHRTTPTRLDEVARAIAGRQHGVVSRGQLLAGGVAAGTIDGRLASGRLRPLHRGVYLVGPVVPPLAVEMAAALACGPGAWVSQASAARVRGILEGGLGLRPVQVTVTGRRRRHPGIRMHRTTTLDPSEVETVDGIPLTTVSRTLLDLAARFGGRRLERVIAEALGRRLATRGSLERLIDLHAGHPGVRRLRTALMDRVPARTRSPLEERLLAIFRQSDLPEPAVNQRVGPFEVDFLWAEARLIAEADGYPFHSTRLGFERDRDRDAELLARGYRVARVTAQQLERPHTLITRFTRMLEGPHPG